MKLKPLAVWLDLLAGGSLLGVGLIYFVIDGRKFEGLVLASLAMLVLRRR